MLIARGLSSADRVKQSNSPPYGENRDGGSHTNNRAVSSFAASAAVVTAALFTATHATATPPAGTSKPREVWPPVGGIFDSNRIDEYGYARNKEGTRMKDVDLIASMRFQKPWKEVRLDTDGDVEDEEEAPAPKAQDKLTGR